MLRQPGISPDGRQIAFVHGGDVYLVSAMGGEASRLTDTSAPETSPRFSPDGGRLAYTSHRTGGGDVYVRDLGSGAETRLTFHGATDVVESWSPDGGDLYFSSDSGEIGGYTDLFSIPAEGGAPTPISRARYEGEYNASISPDGAEILINTNDRTRQWWRTGPRTDDSTDIWLRATDPAAIAMQRLTAYEGKDSWPLWAPDQGGFYFVTDRFQPVGVENLAYQRLSSERPRQITHFEDGRVLWPSIARDGTIVFERDFAIWTLRPGQSSRRLQVTMPTSPTGGAQQGEHAAISDIAFTPDLGEAALILHGDVFHYDLRAQRLSRITDSPSPEQAPTISADGRRIAYSSLRGDYFDLYVYDRQSSRERRLTDDPDTETFLRLSPDNVRIAFAAGPSRLRTVRLADSALSTVAEGSMLEPNLAWSPDSNSIAYMAADANWISNAYVRSVSNEAPARQITDLPNVYFSGLGWTEDGQSLLLSTWSTRENRQIVRVNIAAGVTSPNQATAYLAPEDESLILAAVSPNGRHALLFGTSYGVRGLWRAEIGERRVGAPQLIARGASVGGGAIGNDGVAGFVLDGALHLARPTEQPERLAVSAVFERDPREERTLLFRQIVLTLRDYLTLAEMTNETWEQIYERYAPFAAGADGDDFDILVRMLIGELNVSHTSWQGDAAFESEPSGELGVDFDPNTLRDGRFIISEVFQATATRRTPLAVGAHLLSVGGVQLGAATNIDALLLGKIGQTVEAEIAHPNGERQSVTLPVFAPQDMSEARHQDWVAANERLVRERSGGRLVYAHLRHIGAGATEDLRRRLGASALRAGGLVLDIRNNGGGIESTRLASFLQSTSAVSGRFQSLVDAPYSLVQGIPSFGLPVVLVQNEQVLSDAENFSHEFRQRRMGRIVGTRTAGWVRGQRGYTLFDGSRLSVGAFEAFSNAGESFDQRGREPDIYVDRTPEESLTGRDSQLEAAVDVLLRSLRGPR